MIFQENRSDSAEGFKTYIEKSIKRIMLKLSDRTDKWGSDYLIHINNAKRHSNLCRRKNGRIYAPLPIKRAYINEIWLSELPPPAGVDTQELLNFVIVTTVQRSKRLSKVWLLQWRLKFWKCGSC